MASPVVPNPPPSYEALARFMSSNDGMIIFKRFGKLNARNLLFIQAELLHLQHELDEIISVVQISKDNKINAFDSSISALLDSDAPEAERLKQLMVIVRAKLKEYSDTRYQTKPII
jgi:hypothetical protein